MPVPALCVRSLSHPLRESRFGGRGRAKDRNCTHEAPLSGRSRRPRDPDRGVTARAVIIGLILTPANIFFLVKATWTVGGFTGSESLFANTVALLSVLAVLNQWLKRRGGPIRPFGTGEMLTIYLLLGMGTGLVGSVWDLGGSLAGTITYPFWFATPENRWRELLWPNLPGWLTVEGSPGVGGVATRAGRRPTPGP